MIMKNTAAMIVSRQLMINVKLLSTKSGFTVDKIVSSPDLKKPILLLTPLSL